MKFDPYIKATRRPVTGRRLAAARRALQRQADSVALFPELAPKKTPAERIDRFDSDSVAMVQRMRDHQAQTWRRARRQLRALTPEQRAEVMRQWSNKFLPRTAVYLADIIFTITRR